MKCRIHQLTVVDSHWKIFYCTTHKKKIMRIYGDARPGDCKETYARKKKV